MSAQIAFLWGFVGSCGVEIVTLVYHYQNNIDKLPDRYFKFGFYVVRFLLAIVAGGLAVAYQIQNPMLAIHVGAATPLIMQTLAKSHPSVDIDTESTHVLSSKLKSGEGAE